MPDPTIQTATTTLVRPDRAAGLPWPYPKLVTVMTRPGVETGYMSTWVPPAPRLIPQWRAALRDLHRSPDWHQGVARTIMRGQATIVPYMPGLPSGQAELAAASVLCDLEARRLAEADLFFASADMTALAKAAASIPPIEPVSMQRLPAPTGFLVFGEPIGAYPDPDAGHPADRDISIVAVAWSPWSVADATPPGAGITWWANIGDGLHQVAPGYAGIWLTFYMAPSFTAARMPLLWNNELVMVPGTRFDAAPSGDSTGEWAQVVYTAWQLMMQTGRSRLVDTETVPRDRAGRRRDDRDGITGGRDVRVVNVHSAHRPRATTEPPAGAGAREWSHRWPVRPHRRDHCMNPHHHAAGDCHHEDRIIPPYIKGPADAPLRLGQTVHLWDHQPPPP
jgi:hypothetical protein